MVPSIHSLILASGLCFFALPLVCHTKPVSSIPRSVKYINNVADPPVRAALARVHMLQSRRICHMRRIARGQGTYTCGKYTEAMLATAVANLQRVAKSSRMSRGLQKPNFKTYVVEPFDGQADCTLLLLHGLGGFALDGLASIVPLLRKGDFLPRTRIIMPQATPRFDPLFNRSDLNSWFPSPTDIVNWNGDQVFGSAGAVASMLDTVSTLLGVSRARAGVGGASQGGALSLAVYMRHGVAAAASVVGFLPVPFLYPNEMTTLSQKAPSIMINTADDEIVGIVEARLSAQVLTSLGRNVTYIEIKGVPHSLGNRRQNVLGRALRFVYTEMAKQPGPTYTNKVDVRNLDIPPVVWELH